MADPPIPRRPRSDTETNVDMAERLAPGTLVAGRYRVDALLGVGGMGVVYRARDLELDQDVALKVLRSDLGRDPEWLDRFRRELILGREVTHRNVVRIHDIGESEGLRFLTMRYVEGRSLEQVLKDGPVPIARALRLLRQLAEALASAHEAGVVHRDLKPANVLLDAEDNAFITDFGVARSLAGDGMTRAGAIVGTPDYLSPEQIAGDPVDGRSDLYALGIVFYEMLTGDLPFAGGSYAEMLAQRLAGRARDIRQTGVQVPLWVREVLRRCLERSPARRYPSARALLGDLDRQSAGRRLRVPRGAIAAVAALALGAAGFFWWRSRERPATSVGAGVPLHAVAVLPLADDTGDPGLAWTGGGVAEMLATRLAEIPQLRTLDPLRVQRTLRDLHLDDGRYDEQALRRLAELLDVDRLVAGSVRRAGPSVRVDLKLAALGPGEGGVRSLSAESADAGGLFRLVAELGRQLAAELGAPARDMPPETASLPAARAYREAREHLLRGDDVGAVPAFERAVVADPRFAAALEGASQAYQNLGYREKALQAAQRAAEAVATPDSRLAKRIQARLALLRGEPARAEAVYGELARLYPGDTEALLDLASAQSNRGDVARAVETLKKVTALDKGDPRGWFQLGKNAILVGDLPSALNDYLVRALTLQQQLGNEQGQADALNALGVAYQRRGDHPQALEKYSAALAVRQRLGDKRGVAVSLRNRAGIHRAMDRLTAAESDLMEAQKGYQAIGDRTGVADVLNDFGALHEARADYAAARTAYQQALKFRRELGDQRQVAQSYDNLGYIFFLEGEYDNALVYWQQGMELRSKAGDKRGIVLSTQNMGFLQTAHGKWQEALRSFLDALEKSRQLELKGAAAISQGNIGILQHYDGRFVAAQQSFRQALDVFRQLGNKRGLTEFSLKEAALLLELGRLEEARARLDAAEAWLKETGNREQSSDHLLLRGEWHARQGQTDLARAAFARALAQARTSNARAAILRARLAAAGLPGASAAELRKVAAEIEDLGDMMLRLRAGETLAATALSQGRRAEALAQGRATVALAEAAGWEAGLYRLHALLARILESQGDREAAARHYEESSRRIAKLREGLGGELRAAFDGLPLVREVEAWLKKAA